MQVNGDKDKTTGIEIDNEQKKRKIPLLTALGIPFSCQWINPILCKIVFMSELVKDEKILTYITHCGTEVQLFPIPKSKNEY